MGVSYKEQNPYVYRVSKCEPYTHTHAHTHTHSSVYIPSLIVICILIQVLNLIFSISKVETYFSISNFKEFNFRYCTHL